MSRRVRFVAALLAITALLFSPMVLALHACPGDGDMDGTCANHCADGKVSLDLAKPPTPLAASTTAILRVAAWVVVALRAPAPDSPFSIAAGPAPPLIRYTVLRI